MFTNTLFSMPFLGKLGLFGMGAKVAFNGGMSGWMCSNVDNIFNASNQTFNDIKLGSELIMTRIEEAAYTTGYECGDRCSDIMEIFKNYKSEVISMIGNNCAINKLASSEVCNLLSDESHIENIFDKIYSGSKSDYDYKIKNKSHKFPEIEYKKVKTENEVAYYTEKENKNGEIAIYADKLQERLGIKITDFFGKTMDTIKSARRHVGWLAQGKTKTLELITYIYNSFIENLRLFISKDLAHIKSQIRKKMEDYELCMDYIINFGNSLLGLIPFLML